MTVVTYFCGTINAAALVNDCSFEASTIVNVPEASNQFVISTFEYSEGQKQTEF